MFILYYSCRRWYQINYVKGQRQPASLGAGGRSAAAPQDQDLSTAESVPKDHVPEGRAPAPRRLGFPPRGLQHMPATATLQFLVWPGVLVERPALTRRTGSCSPETCTARGKEGKNGGLRPSEHVWSASRKPPFPDEVWRAVWVYKSAFYLTTNDFGN